LERVAYEILPHDAADTIQVTAEAQAQQLLLNVDKALTEQKSKTTSSKSKLARVGVGVYYFNHEVNKS